MTTMYFQAHIGTGVFELKDRQKLAEQIAEYYAVEDGDGDFPPAPEADRVILFQHDDENEISAQSLKEFNDDVREAYDNLVEQIKADDDHRRYVSSPEKTGRI